MSSKRNDAPADRVVRRCGEADFDDVLAVINDGAEAYRGVIPADCWHEPYMPAAELAREIADGVAFWGIDEGGPGSGAGAGRLVAVMGLQEVGDVALIRHAYVRSAAQRRGLGGALLAALRARTARPMLVGTWAAAAWAVRFYARHGFGVVPAGETADLLRRYWSVPERQIATSVVLADAAWRARRLSPSMR
jgi:GNAT superfamily N-acetyltransferase